MSNEPQERAKVKIPLHLRLTYDDWKETFKSLTNAELGVFYSIRTLDPYGDRELEIDCTALGADLGLHRTTISRALESLSQKKLIDMEIVKVKVKQKVSNRRLTLLTKAENQSNNEQEEEKESCASTHNVVRPRTDDCTSAQTIAPAHTNERPRTQQAPKPSPSKDSGSPHTSSDYSDFIQTLSNSEREKFLEFAEKEANRLPTPPVLVEKWLAANFTELYKRFVASADGKEAKKEVLSQEDWKAHPQYKEWLHKAYYEGYAWIQVNEAEREQRQKFYMWCHYTDAFAIFEEG
jgi:DNA-binding MarR family transcriptional regulator